MPDPHIEAELMKLAEQLKAFRQQVFQIIENEHPNAVITLLEDLFGEANRASIVLSAKGDDLDALQITQYELYRIQKKLAAELTNQVCDLRQQDQSLIRIKYKDLRNPLPNVIDGMEHEFIKSLYKEIEPIANKNYFRNFFSKEEGAGKISFFIENYKEQILPKETPSKNTPNLPEEDLRKLAEEFKAFRQKILQALESNDIDQAVKSLAKADPSVTRWTLLLDLQKGNVTPLSATQYELYELYEKFVQDYINQIKALKQKNSSLTRLEGKILKDPSTHIALGGEYDFIKSLYDVIEPIAYKDYFSPHGPSARKQILTFISNYKNPVVPKTPAPKPQPTIPEEELRKFANQFEEYRNQIIEIATNNNSNKAIKELDKLWEKINKLQETYAKTFVSKPTILNFIQLYLQKEFHQTFVSEYKNQIKLLKKRDSYFKQANVDQIHFLIPNGKKENEFEFVKTIYNAVHSYNNGKDLLENGYNGCYFVVSSKVDSAENRYYGHILLENHRRSVLVYGDDSYSFPYMNLTHEGLESYFENECYIDQKSIHKAQTTHKFSEYYLVSLYHKYSPIYKTIQNVPNTIWDQEKKNLALTFWQIQMMRLKALTAYHDKFDQLSRTPNPQQLEKQYLESPDIQRLDKIYHLPKTRFVRNLYEMICDSPKIQQEFDPILTAAKNISLTNARPSLAYYEEISPELTKVRNQFIDASQKLPPTITDKKWVDYNGYKVYLPSGLGFLNPYYMRFFVRQTGELGSIIKTQTRHLKNQAVTQIYTKGPYLPYAYQSADNWSRYLVVIGQASAWSGEALIHQNEAVNHFVDYCQQGDNNPLTRGVSEIVRKVDDGITIVGVPLTQTVTYATIIPTQIDHTAYKGHFDFVHGGGAADLLGEDAGGFIQATANLNWSDMGYYWMKLQGHDKAADLLYKKQPKDTQSAFNREDCLDQMIEMGILIPPTEKPQPKSKPQLLFLDGFIEMSKNTKSGWVLENQPSSGALVLTK